MFVNVSEPFLYAAEGCVRVVFQLTGKDPKILAGNYPTSQESDL